MPYETLATHQTPALIIYLLDVSASMSLKLGAHRRIDVVMDALQTAIRQMIFRSTKGGRLASRYRLAMFAYSDRVYDLLGGVQPLEKVAQLGVPELGTQRMTDTAKAFAEAERLLQAEMPNLTRCPAPLICHMTDGEFTGSDPTPTIQRIAAMQVPDGHVLIENIFISDRVLPSPLPDLGSWKGILPTTELASDYAKAIRSWSSPIPQSYRMSMQDHLHSLAPEALLLFPGTSRELVALGFQMSAATPVR